MVGCEDATSIDYEGDVAVLASIRDITERKARERELERQNERLDEFASVVSHDLRSPINVARGSLDLATDTGDHDHLDHASSALDRMESLVEDVLELARQGRLVDETERVALADVAMDAWDCVAAGDATLAVETDDSVEADASRLQELFENLFRMLWNTAPRTLVRTLTRTLSSTPGTASQLQSRRTRTASPSPTTARDCPRTATTRCSSAGTRPWTAAPGSGSQSWNASPTPMAGPSTPFRPTRASRTAVLGSKSPAVVVSRTTLTAPDVGCQYD
jgi:hypothetical protein